MAKADRRKYKRLPIKLDLCCRKVGLNSHHLHGGRTINVSPGGLYFETSTYSFSVGEVLNINLTIPPTAGLLEFGGRISAPARVLRKDDFRTNQLLGPAKCGVAVEFCRSPRLCK